MKSIREALETIEHIDCVRQLQSVQPHMDSDLFVLQQAIAEHLGKIGRCFPEWLHNCNVTEALAAAAAARRAREAGQVIIRHTEAAAYTSTDARQK